MLPGLGCRGRGLIEFVNDFPHEFFQEILKGYQPSGTTVLVDHNRHMPPPPPKLFEERVDARGLRDEKWGV